MIRVASAANAQSTPLTASVAPSEPGTGTVPESNAKHDQPERADACERRGDVAAVGDDSHPGGRAEVAGEERAPRATALGRELVRPEGSPFDGRCGRTAIHGGRGREPRRPSVRIECDAEVARCRDDVAQCAHPQCGAIAGDRRDTRVAGGGSFTRVEEIHALTTRGVRVQGRAVGPADGALHRADRRVAQGLEERVDGGGREHRSGLDQDEHGVVVDVRGERDDGRGHAFGLGHDDRTVCGGREVVDGDPIVRFATAVVDEQHLRA